MQSRNFSSARIYSTCWQARYPLVEGIKRTVARIEAQAVGGSAGGEGVEAGVAPGVEWQSSGVLVRVQSTSSVSF